MVFLVLFFRLIKVECSVLVCFLFFCFSSLSLMLVFVVLCCSCVSVFIIVSLYLVGFCVEESCNSIISNIFCVFCMLILGVGVWVFWWGWYLLVVWWCCWWFCRFWVFFCRLIVCLCRWCGCWVWCGWVVLVWSGGWVGFCICCVFICGLCCEWVKISCVCLGVVWWGSCNCYVNWEWWLCWYLMVLSFCDVVSCVC